jgi:hypothetical protein
MKRHEFQYREAVNGLDALKFYKELISPRFDVILMGIYLNFLSVLEIPANKPFVLTPIPQISQCQ